MPDDTSYHYKQLASVDVAPMHQLLDVFADAFNEPATYSESRPDTHYLTDLLSSPVFIALIAQYQDDVVGGLVAYELKKFEQHRSEIYIYDLAVAVSHRRRGVASGLIRHLQAIARERNAWVIFVQADADDPPAIALYQSLGVRESVLHFDITVD